MQPWWHVRCGFTDCKLALLQSGHAPIMALQHTHLCLPPIKGGAPSLAEKQDVIKHAEDIIAGLVNNCCGGDTHVGHLQGTGGRLEQHSSTRTRLMKAGLAMWGHLRSAVAVGRRRLTGRQHGHWCGWLVTLGDQQSLKCVLLPV